MDMEAQEKETGMYFPDRCQFCHSFGEKIEPYLCPDCVERMRKLGYVKLPPDSAILEGISNLVNIGDSQSE